MMHTISIPIVRGVGYPHNEYEGIKYVPAMRAGTYLFDIMGMYDQVSSKYLK